MSPVLIVVMLLAPNVAVSPSPGTGDALQLAVLDQRAFAGVALQVALVACAAGVAARKQKVIEQRPCQIDEWELRPERFVFFSFIRWLTFSWTQ
jgi:hypothetical protein